MTMMMLEFLGVFVYFAPTGVAWGRHCKSLGGIFVVNLFLGWTLIGWVVALAWAASAAPEVKAAAVGEPNAARF